VTPGISVVLAVHNGERHLEASLRSLREQTFQDFEIIVVDDGSTDRTVEILAALERDEPRAVIVRQPNRGLAASLNTGIGLARGRYVGRQDADDLSRPERFACQSAWLDRDPSVVAVGSSADVIDRSGAIVGALPAALGASAVRRGLLSLRTTPVHGSMLMRTSAVRQAGGYRVAFPAAQDYDLWLRISAAGAMDNLTEPLYQWRLDREGVYATRRAQQLKYAAIALAFAKERAATGRDSYELLERCAGDLDRFVAAYRMGAFVRATWGELLLRGLGNSPEVRDCFRRALSGGYVRPWTVGLFGWTHLGLPWPGGRPLTLTESAKRS
jgi:glycosyltransferase involved in cell wall biosynthesis